MNKLFLFILLLVAGLRAENVQAQYIGGQLSEEATVSILTFGPADPAYTAFGHTAIFGGRPQYWKIHAFTKISDNNSINQK